MKIKDTFDPAKDINRRIEKVITYAAEDDARLASEVSEYVVTEKIEENFEKLLSHMERSMEDGGTNETGVWVSGFYGSGKSSFTKYLAFGLDPDRNLGESSFLESLLNQFESRTLPALYKAVVKRFPAVVVPIDLGSDALAGATMEEISRVLFYKVLSFIGYSATDKKVSYLEMLLDQEGKYEQFKKQASEALGGQEWSSVQDNPLVANAIAAQQVTSLLPNLFPDEQSFHQLNIDEAIPENVQVERMLELLRKKSGKEHVIFVLDEVGQYVASRQNLILNLDGLARNLKEIGQSKAWIIATAQQTLTEDNPHAQLNAPELYRLNARFPIQIDLEASDIKEICHRRLLGKSDEGNAKLGELFDKNGPTLKQVTKLENARFYDSHLEKESFVELYPFLPQHFEILLALLGRLAKSSGGIGLRSAIKIIQDVLVDPNELQQGQVLLSDQEVGSLATTVTFYDSLRSDVERSGNRHLTAAVDRVVQSYGNDSHESNAAKCVAILQILGDLPATASNVAALLHASVDAPNSLEEIEQALATLESDTTVAFSQREGKYLFLSDAVIEIERERSSVIIRESDHKAAVNGALRELLLPKPSASLQGSRTVRAGLRAMRSGQIVALDGDNEDIHFCLVLTDAAEYDRQITDTTQDSTDRSSLNQVFLVAKNPSNLQGNVTEALRCKAMHSKHRQSVEAEVREYAEAQNEKHLRILQDVGHQLNKSLLDGSFLFRGQRQPVSELDSDLKKASDKMMAQVGERIFEKYGDAPVQAPTNLAETVLRAGLDGVTGATDPLSLVMVDNGQPRLKEDHPAIVAIREFISSRGNVDGDAISKHFTAPPYGWSKDTIRYIVAAMFLGTLLKVNHQGETSTVVGDVSLDALRNNQKFRQAGVSLRESRPDVESIARAVDRIEDLTGNSVPLTEAAISEAVSRDFSSLQSKCTQLAGELARLGLPGSDRPDKISTSLSQLLSGDASDAPSILGAEECSIYEDLLWVRNMTNELAGDLKKVLGEIRDVRNALDAFPESGTPGEIRKEAEESSSQATSILEKEDFLDHRKELGQAADELANVVIEGLVKLKKSQDDLRKEFSDELEASGTWPKLDENERKSILRSVKDLEKKSSQDLPGLRELVNHEYDLQNCLRSIKQEAEKLAEKRNKERKDQSTPIAAPRRFENPAEIDEFIKRIEALKKNLPVDVDWQV
jgi:hypothetical protein